ncbi:hypothetical protein DL96DRAFT_1711255 [Flagelloscypha sp. PMI_526]|nr:hypothetical protein DL96DRAFT_1711255 [Flagelloscypha sp. PMI_526]
MSMSNLAVTYFALGWHSEALQLAEQTLERRRKILGFAHPDALLSQQWLNYFHTQSDTQKRRSSLAVHTLSCPHRLPQKLSIDLSPVPDWASMLSNTEGNPQQTLQPAPPTSENDSHQRSHIRQTVVNQQDAPRQKTNVPSITVPTLLPSKHLHRPHSHPCSEKIAPLDPKVSPIPLCPGRPQAHALELSVVSPSHPDGTRWVHGLNGQPQLKTLGHYLHVHCTQPRLEMSGFPSTTDSIPPSAQYLRTSHPHSRSLSEKSMGLAGCVMSEDDLGSRLVVLLFISSHLTD